MVKDKLLKNATVLHIKEIRVNIRILKMNNNIFISNIVRLS